MFQFIDRWIDRLEGKPSLPMSYDASMAMIVANFQNGLGDGKRVVFTGSVVKDKLDRVYEDFCNACGKVRKVTGEQFSTDTDAVEVYCGEDMNVTASTVTMVNQCDAVVLVEQKGKTTFGEIEKAIDAIEALNKRLVGFILI